MILRLDSVGGASGDMLLGCLADLGADFSAIEARLRTVLPEPFQIHRHVLILGGLRGTRVTVEIPASHAAGTKADLHHDPHHHGPRHDQHHHDASPAHDHPHPHPHPHPVEVSGGHHGDVPRRNLPEILALIESADLPAMAAELAAAVFRRLADAEAAVHGTTPDKIHFHEVGATDAVVDILGACLALEQLGVTAVSVGPLPEGEGTLTCEHGVMPIPAPATAELLRGHPVRRVDEPFELVTPTGAALLMTWKQRLPAGTEPYRAVRNGIGFGQRRLLFRPNLLRATLAEPSALREPEHDEVLVLETTLDDCSGEWIGAVMDRLLAAGALDVWVTPVQMKKSRPGVLLSVLCEAGRAEPLKPLLFAETTTFGIREYPVRRTVLERRVVSVMTSYGPVRVKLGSHAGTVLAVQPEFEDCNRLSAAHGVAVRTVFAAAQQTFHSSPDVAATPSPSAAG